MVEKKEFFNLADLSAGIERVLGPGMTTRVFPGDQAMRSIVTMDPSAEGQIHHHPEEQWGMILEGSGVRIQDGVEHRVAAGDFWRTPGNIPHGFMAGPDGAKVLDIFSPPREAYKKAGAGFASG